MEHPFEELDGVVEVFFKIEQVIFGDADARKMRDMA